MNRREFIAAALAIPAIINKKPDALAFEPIAMTAEDSQFIDHMKWSVEDIARAFRVPVEYLMS